MATSKLESEFINLKKEFVGLQSLIQNLLDKHGDLEKKYEKFIHKHSKNNFRCRNCGDKFQALKKLQDHKEEGCSTTKFECDECEKRFKDEDKLQQHKDKMHEKFECDECEKVFGYESVLEKHKEAAHENAELFCHYFNNDKDCPFEDCCIFVHEESGNCRYGKNCERNLCMFQHVESRDIENVSDDDSEDGDSEESFNLHDINLEKIKPVLDKFKQAVDNFELLLNKYSLKCKNCEFEAKDMNGLTMHMKAKHNK